MGKDTSLSRRSRNRKPTNDETVVRSVEIKNELGLHARAAASFVKTAFRYKADIEVIKGDQQANGKSIMGLLTLAAACGTSIIIRATGSDAPAAVAALTALIKDKFGEE